ncbi:hypothetical protein [Nocardia macrotermitis]|nr:hypothetical protein [Nocardia macrotermitis]
MAGQPLRLPPVPGVRAGSWGQLRERLLGRTLPIGTVDAVWGWLIERAREPGPGRAQIALGCLGLAVPMLAAATDRYVAPYSAHREDAESELVAGFLRQLREIDPDQPHLWLRLRSAMRHQARSCAHRQSGVASPAELDHVAHTCLARMRIPAGHPELVLARAVAREVITAEAAELIVSTRWESRSVTSMVGQLPGVRSQWPVRKLSKFRQRAEADLAAWLNQQATDPAPTGTRDARTPTASPGRQEGSSTAVRSGHSSWPPIATAPAARHQGVR